MVRFSHEFHEPSTRMPAPPQEDGITPRRIRELRLVEDSCGVLIEAGAKSVLAHSALTPEELEANLKAHEVRIAAALKAAEPKKFDKPAKEHKGYPPDLKLVNCAGCQKTLLGESQEVLRVRAKRVLPPPVAKRLFAGRPYCMACANHFASEDDLCSDASGSV